MFVQHTTELDPSPQRELNSSGPPNKAFVILMSRTCFSLGFLRSHLEINYGMKARLPVWHESRHRSEDRDSRSLKSSQKTYVDS